MGPLLWGFQRRVSGVLVSVRVGEGAKDLCAANPGLHISCQSPCLKPHTPLWFNARSLTSIGFTPQKK